MASGSVKNKRYPLIPEEERKCVWMTTGLISYKLCDRNFQCEICSFDQAIKSEKGGKGDFQQWDEDWAEISLNNYPSVRINGSVFYHSDHCWVEVENSEKVRIGMDYLLTQLIAGIKVIILPDVGNHARQGECCAHIILENHILPVFSPLSGTILSVNYRLQKEPNLLTEDSRGEGWLIEIKPENLENDLRNLLFGEKALLWYLKEEKEIIALSEDLLFEQGAQILGPTMQDGGVRTKCLQDVLNVVDTRQRGQILDSFIARYGRKA